MQTLMKRKTLFSGKGSLFQEETKLLNVYTHFDSKWHQAKTDGSEGKQFPIRVGDFNTHLPIIDRIEGKKSARIQMKGTTI